jgi:NADPH:quinone reductase-like Zn-dependent oxidoreductase
MKSKMSRRTMIKTTGGTLAMALAPSAAAAATTATGGGTVRAAVIERSGEDVAANVRLVTDWPEPIAAPGEVRVRTEAAALNHVDLWLGRRDWATFPHVSGFDGCGIVETVGDGVDESWLGRRIIFNAAVPETKPAAPDVRPDRPPEIGLIGSETQGSMAEKFVVPAANILDVGDADPIQAAAFALTFLTAWRMISTRARLKPDQTVLVTGIGGGVALAALKIAKYIGSEVIVTSRHQWKLDTALGLGADHGILDQQQDWSEEVRDLTGGRGVDLCVDSVGKAVHARCIQSLAQGGTLTTCGATTGGDAETMLGNIYWKQLSILGSSMGDMDEFREVTALFRAGKLEPVIDTVFPAADAAQAYARLQAGDQFGKVVVRWAPPE